MGNVQRQKGKTGLKVRYVSDRTDSRSFSVQWEVSHCTEKDVKCALAREEGVASDRAQRKSSASGTLSSGECTNHISYVTLWCRKDNAEAL